MSKILPVSLALAATLATVILLIPGGGARAAQSPRVPSAPAPQRVAHAAASTVGTRHTQLGTVLVGPSGRTLYLWEADRRGAGKSVCSGGCAQVWPPLMLHGKLKASGGVKARLLGSIARSGGRQVTYNGWPLYYYVSDTRAGQTTGQGSGSFGAPWYVLSTAGSAIR